jgi:hypothetical protein
VGDAVVVGVLVGNGAGDAMGVGRPVGDVVHSHRSCSWKSNMYCKLAIAGSQP